MYNAVLRVTRFISIYVVTHLKVTCEILQWVRSNEEHRRPKMESILGAVRCHYLSPNFLKDQMKNCDILKKVYISIRLRPIQFTYVKMLCTIPYLGACLSGAFSQNLPRTITAQVTMRASKDTLCAVRLVRRGRFLCSEITQFA